MKPLYLIYFLILFIPLYGKTETITVTSNNDSGPGSLREAIQKANSNGQQNLIHFALNGNTEQDRTIILKSHLPFITSSLTIDATTQPSPAFGRSSAKIIIQPEQNPSSYFAFIIKNANNIHFYGLYVRDFMRQISIYSSYTGFLYAENSKNIIVGASEKGNVISNCSSFIYTHSYSIIDDLKTELNFGIENLKVQGNFVGFEPDGKTPRGNIGSISLSQSKGNIEIGGEDAKERNYFGNSSGILYLLYSETHSKRYPVHLNIINNYFHYDIDGIAIPLLANSNPDLIRNHTLGSETFQYGSAKIINNKSISNYQILLTYLDGPIVLQGNEFLNHPNPIYVNNWRKSIILSSSDYVKIGGENPGEGNVIENLTVYISSKKSAIAQRTSMFCSIESIDSYVFNANGGTIPTIKILSATNNLVTGITHPNAKVELFSDDDCATCQPQSYLTTIMADANGNWSYAGNFSKAVIASATLNGYTSNFTNIIRQSYASITQSTCNEANGSITGLTFENAVEFIWTDENNNVIGNSPDIYNLKPGKYKLTTKNLSCTKTFGEFEIVDMTPVIRDQSKVITHPTCSSLGSISYLYLTKYSSDYNYSWKNERGEEVATRIDAYNLPIGSYTLSVKYKNNCEVTYGPVVLQNQNAPTLSEASINIKTADCSQSNGAITNLGISSSNGVTYKWYNDKNIVVGTNLNLINVPSGKYYLEAKDASGCTAIKSSIFEINELNGISFNNLQINIKNTNCNLNNGSINGISVSGATSYKWINTNGDVISNNLNLVNVASGRYTLEASNNYCTKTETYTIDELPSTIAINSFSITLKDATCNLDNGLVEYIPENYTRLPKSYYWKNDVGQIISQNTTANNLRAGHYQFFGIDDNNCQLLLATHEVKNIAPLVLNDNLATITNSTCQQNNAIISSIEVNGGQPPYQFEWTNNSGQVLRNSAEINNIGKGIYTLKVTDASNCVVYSKRFTVQDQTTIISKPIVGSISVCSPKEVNFTVNNLADNAIYIIYNDEYSNRIIATSNNGTFKLNIAESKSYYVSAKIGNCESERSELKIYAGFSSQTIPNTISPNNDNINDVWLINGIENYPTVQIQIFSRSGSRVYSSIGYKKPFDGTYNNTPLPIGVYYYVINFGSECKTITGNLNIIR